MKRRYILGLLLIIGGYFIVDNLLVNNKENDNVETDVNYVKHENALSMMLETESGSGEYTLETRSSWPTQDDGYIFNSTLSKCENGSKLSWDSDNNAVIMTGNVSDKCYVYFDKFSLITFYINNNVFYAEEGSTWNDWVNSKYNVDSYCKIEEIFSTEAVICNGSYSVCVSATCEIGSNLIKSENYNLGDDSK